MKHLTFGEIIKQSRENRKISQEALSRIIKKKYNVRLSTSYLSMIETNVRTNLTVNLINALLDYFELPFETSSSLFANLQHHLPYAANPVIGTVHETRTTYTAQKKSALITDFDAGLPPEAHQSLNDFHNFLIAKYNQDKKLR